VLLDKLFNPLLCDLASCRPIRIADTRKRALEIQEDAERYCTASYRPPELHDVKTGSTLDGKVDVFGLGCILYFAKVGRNPFESAEGFLKLALMQGSIATSPDDPKLSKQFSATVKAMLRANPEKRFSVDACIKKLDKMTAK